MLSSKVIHVNFVNGMRNLLVLCPLFDIHTKIEKIRAKKSQQLTEVFNSILSLAENFFYSNSSVRIKKLFFVA